MTSTATFTVEMHPGQSLITGSARFDFTKTWTGALEGTSRGAMLTAGDPATGSAGYVALEVFDGRLDGRTGTIALQQLGTMDAGEPELQFVLAPGSGTGELAELTGTLTIESVGDDGVHQVNVTLS